MNPTGFPPPGYRLVPWWWIYFIIGSLVSTVVVIKLLTAFYGDFARYAKEKFNFVCTGIWRVR